MRNGDKDFYQQPSVQRHRLLVLLKSLKALKRDNFSAFPKNKFHISVSIYRMTFYLRLTFLKGRVTFYKLCMLRGQTPLGNVTILELVKP